MDRHPRDWFKPLAIGAPEPPREIPVLPGRDINFIDPTHKMVEKVPGMVGTVDVVCFNHEDAIDVGKKEDARASTIRTIGAIDDFQGTQVWARVNSIDSQWFLPDVMQIVKAVGQKLDVLMLPKIRNAYEIYYVDQLLAQLEAEHELQRPILLHAILETPGGVNQVRDIAFASPRLQGISIGPADLAASRYMMTMDVGGGHAGAAVIDPTPGDNRQIYLQDLWHHTLNVMVDACREAYILPFYGPFGNIKDLKACEVQFQNAYVAGCVGAWSLYPTQAEVARRVFTPSAEEVARARKVMEEMPDGRGVRMIEGKFVDDAVWKQCRVQWELAQRLAKRDPELAKLYGFTE